MAKSVAKNALYSGIRTLSFMLFPLVTYPYVTRVLMAENLGKIDFSVSFVSYFLLIAALGINTYATREGAGLRKNKEELDRFSSEVFTINMVSTGISYALLALFVLLWPHLRGYTLLIAIQSITIIGTTMGVEWVYSLEEDFGYITARTILVQGISTILMFLLVRKPDDYVIYAAITVLSSVGGNVFNWFRARRYARIRLVWHVDWRRHLTPMLVLFGNAIAVTIYVNIDVSLLSVMRGDVEVGVYGVAVKIYRMVKQLLNALVTVSLPRFSLYVAQNEKEAYTSLLLNLGHGLLVVVAPALMLLLLLAEPVVLIVGGEGFLGSTASLRILCAAGFFAVWGNYVTNAILLPHGKERLALKCTVVGAVVNLLLNFVFIPLWGMVGAALTTVIAEASVVVCALRFSRRQIDLPGLARQLLSALVSVACGMAAMTLAYLALQHLPLPWVPAFLVRGLALVCTYGIVLLMRRDQLVLQGLGLLATRIRHGKK